MTTRVATETDDRQPAERAAENWSRRDEGIPRSDDGDDDAAQGRMGGRRADLRVFGELCRWHFAMRAEIT